MAGLHLTMRLDEDTFRRLETHRRRLGTSRSELGRTLLEEGLRMEEHPGIIFRSGPAGRRAALSGGPDIWEVARVLRDAGAGHADRDDTVQRMATVVDITPEQVRIVLRYYAEHSDEVDGWLDRVDEEAERAEAAWHREQALIGR